MAACLKRRGYKVLPVNPTISLQDPAGEETLGEKSYPRLEDIPELIGVVDIFRAPEHVPPIVVGAKVVWMQLGVVNEEAAEKARGVVKDRCMMQEHERLPARVGR